MLSNPRSFRLMLPILLRPRFLLCISRVLMVSGESKCRKYLYYVEVREGGKAGCVCLLAKYFLCRFDKRQVAPKTAYLALLTISAWSRQERSRSTLKILALASARSLLCRPGCKFSSGYPGYICVVALFAYSCHAWVLFPPFFGIQLQLVSLMFAFSSFHYGHRNC